MKVIISQHNSHILTLNQLADQASNFARKSKSDNTRRAYKSDWTQFSSWCSDHKLNSLPTTHEVVILYITAYAEILKVATLARRLAAISEAHKIAGLTSPTEDKRVKMVWAGIRRLKGVHQNAKHPLLTSDLQTIITDFKDDLISKRDRALLLLGYSGGFRRSELVALNRDDLSFVKEGIVVRLKRSKTDQEGIGTEKAIPYGSNPLLCPVRAIVAWIEASKEITDPLFISIKKGNRMTSERLSAKAVALIIKQRLKKVGYDIAEFSAHSLRSGFCTQSAMNGASDRAIMQQTKHRTRAMVDRYVRVASIWSKNASTKLGL